MADEKHYDVFLCDVVEENHGTEVCPVWHTVSKKDRRKQRIRAYDDDELRQIVSRRVSRPDVVSYKTGERRYSVRAIKVASLLKNRKNQFFVDYWVPLQKPGTRLDDDDVD